MKQVSTLPATFNLSLSSLRILAILVIVAGHFYLQGHDYMLSTAVSLCFMCSGYLTALHHPFEPYSIKEHLKFFGRRVARLYPMHVLAVALCVLAIHHAINWKVVLSHLSMLQSFVPEASYYFGYNPVSWFVSTILFLFFMAPWLIKALRLLAPRWQWVLISVLLVLQFASGYTEVLNRYHLYQFPPMRLLDFAVGIAIFNLSQTQGFRQAQQRLKAHAASLLEVGAVAVFVIFYIVGLKLLHPHCFRACCSSFIQVFIIITIMVFTQGNNGIVSKALQWRPLTWLDNIGMEIFLLQLSVYLLLAVVISHIGIASMPFSQWPVWAVMLVHIPALLLAAWIAKRWFSTPIYRFYLAKIEPKLIGAKAA